MLTNITTKAFMSLDPGTGRDWHSKLSDTFKRRWNMRLSPAEKARRKSLRK